MKREIKFRAFDKISKQMYRWSQIASISLVDFEKEHYELMQFTGLKDKNGVDIYEGDIVKWTLGSFFWQAVIKTVENNRSSTLYAIETIHNCSTDESGEKYTYEISNSRNGFRNEIEYLSKVVEVIGNIHENPELLC